MILLTCALLLDCENGFYGESCDNTCGYCFNGEPCDNINGKCKKGCESHFQNPLCKGEQKDVYF